MSFDHIFSGEYVFERSISSPRLSFLGKACFLRLSSGQHIQCEEYGTYLLDGKNINCHNLNFYKLTDKSLIIEKSDHSILHEFLLPTNLVLPMTLSHEHICGQDHYICKMHLKSKESFALEYSIIGPQKNYQIWTNFQRY